MDVAGIEPGKDFRTSIDENVAQCGVLLAVIGRQWLTIADSAGARRLDSPNDFVRLEIASALARNIPVIPVLVQNAAMPTAQALPQPLQDLAYRNAVELTLPRWNSDVALLVAALKKYVHATPETAAEPIHATVPVQLPAPATYRASRSKTPLYAGAAATLLLIALAIYFFIRSSRPTTQYQVSLPFNATGIYADGATFAGDGGIANGGYALHPFEKMLVPGSQLLTTHDGTVFFIGPTGVDDMVRSPADQPLLIPLPAQRYATLSILCAAAGQPAPAAPFYVNYSTRKALHLQGISAFAAEQKVGFPGESLVLTQTYMNRSDGTRSPARINLYAYRFKLDPTLALESLSVPAGGNIYIFAVTLIP